MNEYYDKKTGKYSAKIVFVGENGVGKTNLIRRFVGANLEKKYNETKVSNFYTKTVKIRKREIELNFWDAPGAERYRYATRVFLKEAHVLLLVYDITNQKSFDELKNYWMEDIKKYEVNPKCK